MHNTPTLTNTSAIMTLPDNGIRRLQENTNLKLDETMHPHEIKLHTSAYGLCYIVIKIYLGFI
jgi:hypothetical protein